MKIIIIFTSLLAELKNQIKTIGLSIRHIPTFNFTYDRESGRVILNVGIANGNHSKILTIIYDNY